MIEMNENPRVLLLAYYFPPDSSSGALRPLFFANHLQEMGINVTVLTACEENFLPEQPKDPGLCSRLHKDVKIVRAKVRRPREFVLSLRDNLRIFKKNENVDELKLKDGCSKPANYPKGTKKSFAQNLKDLITDLLASPDPHVGWIWDAVKQGRKIIKRDKISVILATGSPWSCMIAGVLLRNRNIPLVLDFRDPWVANPGFVQRGNSAAFLEKHMERLVVAKANAIVANTEELRDNFLQRFSFLKPEKVYTISNGFENFFASDVPVNKRFTVVHAGALYFSRTPLPLLEALYALLKEDKIPRDRIRLFLVGGISVEDEKLKELLHTSELKEVVQLIPRLPYREAMEFQLQSDVLLLIQPGFPLQVPRKLYEYMAMKRPVLALTEQHGATARIVRECKMGRVVENTSEHIQPVLYEMYTSWMDNCDKNILSMGSVSKYKNSNLTKKLYTVLQETIVKNI